MFPIFDKDSTLCGWLSKDRKYIFDINVNWVAFVSNDESVWTVNNKSWVGVLRGSNVHDVEGKTAFWNPETKVENSLRPLKPLNPLTPLRPLTPLNPLKSLKPIKPLTPIGGWSSISWKNFVDGIA